MISLKTEKSSLWKGKFK